jgi:hypothetical protein
MGSWKRRGPQTEKPLPQSPFTDQFFEITTFGIAFYQSNLSTPQMQSGKETICTLGKNGSVF